MKLVNSTVPMPVNSKATFTNINNMRGIKSMETLDGKS